MGRQREGGGLRILKNEETSFMDMCSEYVFAAYFLCFKVSNKHSLNTIEDSW